MWFLKKKEEKRFTTMRAEVSFNDSGTAIIDVRGQTCPGYLLAINNAVAPLPAGTTAQLLISYPPCGDDVHAWCKEKSVEFRGIVQEDGLWKINIQK